MPWGTSNLKNFKLSKTISRICKWPSSTPRNKLLLPRLSSEVSVKMSRNAARRTASKVSLM